MRKIRKLSLQNRAGERWSLNGGQGVFASELSGFGTTITPTFADLGHGFFSLVSDDTEPQIPIPFTLTFTQTPYESYQQLVNWLFAAGTVTLVYDPTGNQEYYRDVSVNFLQKGEKNEVGWLEIPCSFQCHTPWYLPSPTTLSMSIADSEDVKRYSYTYSRSLRYGSDSSAVLSGIIAGSGHVPGSLELRYHGAITNPRIRLVGNVSGKTYGICSITANFAAGDILMLSTRYERSGVTKVTPAGVETDLLDALDLSTEPFFHIPVDEPCTISIEADAPFTGWAELLVFYYFRSV